MVTTSFSFDHLPSAQEIAIHKLTIADNYQKIRKKNASIKDLRSHLVEDPEAHAIKMTLQTDEKERDDLVARNALILAFISPIRRIPAEIMGEVFISHVNDHHSPPWSVLAVCREWRYVGMSTPRMWNRIHLVNSSIHTISLPFHFGSQTKEPPLSLPWFLQESPHGVTCGKKDKLNAILKLSGIIPLDISIALRAPEPTDFQEMIETLWNNNGHRWRSLRLSMPFMPSFATLNPAKLTSDLCSLTSIHFDVSCNGEFVRHIMNKSKASSKSLTNIEVFSGNVANEFQNHPQLLSSAVNVIWDVSRTSFPIMPLPISGGGFSPLRPMKRLKTLVLTTYEQDALRSLPDNQFQHLEILALSGINFKGLDNFDFGSLTHISLKNMSGPADEVDQYSISLPNVTHFSMTGETYFPLTRFIFSSLDTLELYCSQLGRGGGGGRGNEDLDAIWNRDGSTIIPHPRCLYLEVKANDAYLLAALGLITRLEVLVLYLESPTSVGTKIFNSLAAKPKKNVKNLSTWKSPMCPELKEFVVKCVRGTEKSKQELQEELLKIKRVRAGTASEMKKVAMGIWRPQSVGLGSRNRATELANPM